MLLPLLRRVPGKRNCPGKLLLTLPEEGLPLPVDDELGDEAGGVDEMKSLRMGMGDILTKACVVALRKRKESRSRRPKEIRGEQRFLGPSPTNIRVSCDRVCQKGAVHA